MINLAGNKEADKTILEELYLAGIEAVKVERGNSEVPYSYIGKIGNWKLRRAWYYWIASVEDAKDGLPLKEALELHNKKHPTDESQNLGNFIRSGGHGGCLSPDEYGAQPIYNEELEEKLKALGCEEKEFQGKKYVSATVGHISELCNEGKLDVERYVDCYHIDTQIGLLEFAKSIMNK